MKNQCNSRGNLIVLYTTTSRGHLIQNFCGILLSLCAVFFRELSTFVSALFKITLPKKIISQRYNNTKHILLYYSVFRLLGTEDKKIVGRFF